ncbi:hypothetical protein [Butyrivibrio sp. WCD3002]|uniref:hypothetical protein n=1 Tax=Butyrivibrio sp. WCD3002 TaxID=1280676 RepID=UPI0004789F8F|nr:hypothetical protein [Butyrivibrio sp. WCD3002]
MEKKLFDEMVQNLNSIDSKLDLQQKTVFLFGHCNATLECIDFLEKKGIKVKGILDNSIEKQGIIYKDAKVIYPNQIFEYIDGGQKNAIVLITSRFYAAMLKQLRDIGYEGIVRKVIDYNTYAEYSLSKETIERMTKREQHGELLLEELSSKYPGCFKVFCPFNALGDIYFMRAYFPAFAREKGIGKTVFCVPSKVLSGVIRLFDDENDIEVYEPKELDAMIQAVLYTRDENSYIAHQDRPYVINLSKALYIKKINLEQIYCCGVYGLPVDTVPEKPRRELMRVYPELEKIPSNNAVIFSPYAKSVTAIDFRVWSDAVSYYTKQGYKCFTNVVGEEMPLDGTEAISPSISELFSVVERAGTFIGIRSGLCDILREAKAKKIAIYPDYNYCDTKWKSIDIYYIKQFDRNIVEAKDIIWDNL